MGRPPQAGEEETKERAPAPQPAGDLRYEIQVKTRWAELLDPSPPPVVATQVSWGGEPKEVWLVEGLFTPDECKALLAAAEEHGFGATNYPKHYRGNLRLTTADTSLAEAVWGRLQPVVPPTLLLEQFPHRSEKGVPVEWAACGLNECWRLAKYYPSDRFGVHCDACFERDAYVEMSMLTVNIYMNGGFDGGSTRFWFSDIESRSDPGRKADFEVAPKAGLCVLFRQPPGQAYLHDGEELASGMKYLFRSDVMYRKTQ